MPGLGGTSSHSLDAKGRIFFPARLREAMGEKLVILRSTKDCLMVFSEPGWEEFNERIHKLSFSKGLKIRNYFYHNMQECTIDGQGRVLLSENLRAYAGLEKEVVVTGSEGYAEIWQPDRWNTYLASISTEDIESMMDEEGF